MSSTFQQDIEAGRGPADTEQYGLPEYADEVNESAGMPMSAPAPSAPISGDNLDRGAIPEDESAGLDTASPAQPQPQSQPQPEARSRSGLDFDASHVPGNAKRIVSYLMGSDAIPPQALAQAGAQADPHGQLGADDRNLLAVEHAAQTQGPAAAWKLVQANRVAYNAKQAFAKTALQGIQGKPADLNAAIDAANQASQHILDGSSVQFTPAPNGVTATVKLPGTSQVQQLPLTVQQFGQWLNVGADGQWDKVMERGAPATLQRIAKGQAPARGATNLSQMQPLQRPPQQQPQGNPSQDEQPQGDQSQGNPSQDEQPQDEQPQGDQSQGNQSQGNQSPTRAPPQRAYPGAPIPTDEENYGAELQARSRKIFPGAGQEPERQQWMAAQEEKELARKNAVAVASEKGKWADKRAATAGGYRVQQEGVRSQGGVDRENVSADARKYAADKMSEAQKSKVMQELARQERIAQSTASRNAASLLRQKLQNNLFEKMTPEEDAQVKRMIGAGDPAAAPQQANPHGAPAASGGKKIFNGKLYTREEYERDVLGKR